MENTIFNEDVVNLRSLTNLKGFEWRHLKQKCHELHLESVMDSLINLNLVANLARFTLYIEALVISHVIMLLLMVDRIEVYTLVPYALVGILTPVIGWYSFQKDLKHPHVIHTIVSVAISLLIIMADLFESTVLRGASLEGFKVYLLGVSVSLIYFSHTVWVAYRCKSFIKTKIVTYGLYLFLLNAVMVFCKLQRLYETRRWIVTRYQLVLQGITFKVVFNEERALLESILPQRMSNFLREDMSNRLAYESKNVFRGTYRNRKLYIEPYQEVTILVADMVNYTYLTSQMRAHELVEILHELFVNFDLAAKNNKVLRIKFLGDAYNCVAGIPTYFPTHAHSCIDQALEMISITQQLSHRKNLNINMRIGVHTGGVLAGIIGHSKWQFDIWSKDVDITNRLEASGKPGLVHISERTMGMLGDQYVIENGTDAAKLDPILQSFRTYLVSSRSSDAVELSDLEEHSSSDSSRESYASFVTGDVYDEIRTRAHREMIEEMSHIPVGRRIACLHPPKLRKKTLYEEHMFKSQIEPVFHTFRDLKMEWRFVKQPDLMMKYSMFVVAIATIVILKMVLIDPSESTDEVVPFNATPFGYVLPLLLLCLLALFKKLWLQRRPLTPMTQPKLVLFRWLLKGSELIEGSLPFRVSVAVVSLLMLYFMSSQRVFLCDIAQLEIDVIDADLHNVLPDLKCFLPWAVTYAVALILSLLLVFSGVPLVIKVALGIFILGSHLGTVHAYYGFAFERSRTTNAGLKADWAHTWYLITFFSIVLIRERHFTYIVKAMFYTRHLYLIKHEQTQASTRTIKVIMANILPSHVAEVFKQRRRQDQLYYENISKVAVMFAVLDHTSLETVGLRVLHEIIGFFDDLLAKYQGNHKVEKIKVIGWTYMACCGLDVEDYTDFSVSIQEGLIEENEDVERPEEPSERNVRFASILEEQDPAWSSQINAENVVLTMTEFAFDLFRIIEEIGAVEQGSSYSPLRLKIGIAHGPVMAGVVGLSKPHYDIWGHAVNMASRMASTGVQGRIQVPRKTAKVLRAFNIHCEYRGPTPVKGVGDVPTYLVALEQDKSETQSDTPRFSNEPFQNVEFFTQSSTDKTPDIHE
ncbi:adenylyl cyclase X E-like isoform X2 [Drosophila bipectinata]|uniref:adenylyl cyclase X E-like isoform X2 n=1 Tax=Drosophila bipectinata TaxID=42026 RepID=UPI0038B3C1EB